MSVSFKYYLGRNIPLDIEVTSFYNDPGVLDKLPEDCYPPERDVSFGTVTNIYGRESSIIYKLIDWDDVESKFWEAHSNGELID
jgi:hypothetical protein